MSIEAIVWVLKNSHSRLGQRLVMTSIANYMNDLDESFPSIDTIASDAFLSPRQVIDCIPKLERLGELAVLRGQGVPGRGGRTNLYRFPLMPPSKRAQKSHEKSARLSGSPPADSLPRGPIRRPADSSPLPDLKAMQFPAERGEKSRLETSPDPLRTFSGTENPESPLPPNGGRAEQVALFQKLYETYPKGTRRMDAFRVFATLDPTPALTQEIIQAVEGYKQTATWRERPRYIPSLANFLRRRQWLDCYPEIPVDARGGLGTSTNRGRP